MLPTPFYVGLSFRGRQCLALGPTRKHPDKMSLLNKEEAPERTNRGF